MARTKVIRYSVAGLAGIALIFHLTSSGGRTWFSPDELEWRQQSEYLLPFTSVPIYRSREKTYRNELVTYLVSHRFWSPRSTDTPRWILTNHWNAQWKDGHSELQREFGWNSLKWINWTKSNPEMASELWPRVLANLRKGNKHYDSQAITLMKDAERRSSLPDIRDENR